MPKKRGGRPCAAMPHSPTAGQIAAFLASCPPFVQPTLRRTVLTELLTELQRATQSRARREK